MARRTLFIGVIALIVMTIVLVNAVGRHPYSENNESGTKRTGQAQSVSVAGTTPGNSINPTLDPASDESVGPQAAEPESRACRYDRQGDLKWVREETMEYVQKAYSLLLGHLGLTESEKVAMIEFLVEVQMSTTMACNYDPQPIEEQDRLNGIAAIVGDERLRQFLTLEENIYSYGEVQYMEEIAELYDIPMTDAQLDQMLAILIDSKKQKLDLPGANYETRTIEWVEYRLAELDERNRLVFEQASSVLSAEQLRYIYEQYQRDSYRRADSLEQQKRALADESIPDLPPHFPARGTPDPPR